MKRKLFQNKLIVKKSKLHGYGVFAGKTIKKGERIEECYMLISRTKNRDFDDYYFDAKGKYAIMTGFGCIYNHAEEPNADYIINVKTRIATFVAQEKIPKGSEIFVTYGDDWFENRGIKMKKLKKS